MSKNDLKTAVRAILPLSHDELLNLFEFLAHERHEENKDYRTGFTPRRGKMPPGEALAVIMPVAMGAKDDRLFIDEIVRTLVEALQPVENRTRKADGGHIQTKWIPRNVLELETDAEGKVIAAHVVRRYFGPYLYLRRWATAGDRDKRKSRLKNYYIGRKDLAVHFEALKMSDPDAAAALADEIIAAWEADQDSDEPTALDAMNKDARTAGAPPVEPPDGDGEIQGDVSDALHGLDEADVKAADVLTRWKNDQRK
jgi:hypothetical protein